MDLLATALVVVGAVVVALLGVGILLLFRNRDGAKPSGASGLPALKSRASLGLVRIDDQLSDADNELGFAVAQFGEQKTADFASAVQKSRAMATAAFKLKRELEDAFPESVTKQREMTLQIIALTEAAEQTLASQDRSFSELRSAEVNAGGSIAALAEQIAAASTRLSPAQKTLDRLAKSYRPTIAAEHEKAIEDARRNLDEAKSIAAAAAKALSPSGVNAVVGDVQTAERSARAATVLLDSIDDVAAKLDAAAETVASLVTSTRADLVEARAEREKAPDADTGEAIVDAIDRVEKVLSAVGGAKKPSDPVESLDQLNVAIAELDTALASARNQTQRLAHARAALEGTLVSAVSQVAAVRGFITAGGSEVGAEARTRLNEAERELKVAQAEADPVDALDAARRAVTHARDADALARYDAIH